MPGGVAGDGAHASGPWRDKAAPVPEEHPERAVCVELADGYDRLATLLEQRRWRPQPEQRWLKSATARRPENSNQSRTDQPSPTLRATFDRQDTRRSGIATCITVAAMPRREDSSPRQEKPPPSRRT